jgi:hypothetical protein
MGTTQTGVGIKSTRLLTRPMAAFRPVPRHTAATAPIVSVNTIQEHALAIAALRSGSDAGAPEVPEAVSP